MNSLYAITAISKCQACLPIALTEAPAKEMSSVESTVEAIYT